MPPTVSFASFVVHVWAQQELRCTEVFEAVNRAVSKLASFKQVVPQTWVGQERRFALEGL